MGDQESLTVQCELGKNAFSFLLANNGIKRHNGLLILCCQHSFPTLDWGAFFLPLRKHMKPSTDRVILILK